ncbi:MAG: cyclopropane-fatty-acyl-phospholipid synthase [Arthrobacter sp.]|nr:cyclopropane-fatty-acyl-phospholipid synthase [Arthrobacter sp.]
MPDRSAWPRHRKEGGGHDDNAGCGILAGRSACHRLGTEEIPVRLRHWDGSEAGPDDAPVLVFRSRRALRRMLWSPGQLGLSRAYVAGDIDAPGDIFASFTALSSAGKFAKTGPFHPPSARELFTILKIAVRLGALGPNPAPPPEEAPISRHGRSHTRSRDAVAISHHSDVGNDFYALILGTSMVYSCAVWENAGTGLNAAQEEKTGPGLPQAGVGAGHAGAGRRLRLGQLCPARCPRLRRRCRRRHAFHRTGDTGPQAGGRRRLDRPSSTTGSRTTATSTTVLSTPSAPSACPSMSAARRPPATSPACTGCCARRSAAQPCDLCVDTPGVGAEPGGALG